MTGKQNRIATAAAALSIFAAASAQAQNYDRNQDRNRRPQPARDTRSSLPGWMFTPFPINGAKAAPPMMNPFGGGAPVNVNPLNGPLGGINSVNGGTIIIQQPGYPTYPAYTGYGYPGYPYGGAGNVVIVNPDPYPVGQTVVRPTNPFAGYAFPGYTTTFVSGRTFFSPFGYYAGCPRYVSSRYVVLGAPYPYLDGRDTNIVISPWSASDPYLIANASRGQSLGVALRDIIRFWEQDNAAGLRRRVQPDVPVAVFDGDRLLYSLRRVDFLALAADASDQVQTTSFRFTDVRERSDGLVNAYAQHTYRSRSDGATHTAQVRYTLVYIDGDWYLSATSITPGTV